MDKFFCDNCGEEFDNDTDITMIDNECFCVDCFYEKYSICDNCGEYVEDTCSINDGEQHWCASCTSEEAYFCEDCSASYTSDHIIYINNKYVCRDCVDSGHYYQCEECGEYHHLDDMESHNGGYYCLDCFSEISIIGYYHKGHENGIQFFGNDSSLFFGVELEIDRGWNKNSCAKEVLDAMGNDFIHLEDDSSLSDGFEIITQPATLEYHKSIIENYDEMFYNCKANGFGADSEDSCGMHVHFSKDYFKDNDECIMNLLYLVDKFWDKLVKFSRRDYDCIKEWADKHDKSPQEIVEDMKKYNLSRYKAVNLSNVNTIELRIFQGTIETSNLMATLELCNNLVTFSKDMNINEINALTWDDMMNTDELKAYWEKYNI